MMDFPRFITTKDVPQEHLRSAMLVGSIPFKALRSDPRVSYTLYIPERHYNPDPSVHLLPERQTEGRVLDFHYHLPPLPLVVTVHGTGRNAENCRDGLESFAESERVAVLSPLFPAGIDSYTDLDNYKLLSYKTLRSDLALLSMLDEVALRWPGINTKKVFMMGFSGGGQFVHRFMYLYSERLLAASVGAPGSVTMLDKSLKWPHGIQDLTEIFGLEAAVNIENIRTLPIQLVVGGEDNNIHGGKEFWSWLKEKKEEFAKAQGLEIKPNKTAEIALRNGRLDNMKALQVAWQEKGIRSTLNIVEGVRHDSTGVLDAVQSFLRPLVKSMPR